MRVLLVFFSVLLLSCSSTKQAAEKPTIEDLDALVEQREFTLNAEWAYPLGTAALNTIINSFSAATGNSGNSIYLSGQTAFIKVNGEDIDASLPFYGERRNGNIFNAKDTGVNFKGKPRNLVVEKNDKKKFYTIDFDIDSLDSNTELFEVTMKLFHNNDFIVTINSTHRTSMTYRGKIKKTEEKVALK